MRATQMKLKRVLVFINATTVLALDAFLILVLCFDMSVNTRPVNGFVTIRALHMRRTQNT